MVDTWQHQKHSTSSSNGYFLDFPVDVGEPLHLLDFARVLKLGCAHVGLNIVPADDVSSAVINTVGTPLRTRGADVHPFSIFSPVRLVFVNEVPLHNSQCEGHRESFGVCFPHA